MKPHIIRIYDEKRQRPVWQALVRHSDGTREVVAASKKGLSELGDLIADWHMHKIISAKRALRAIK